ncbi:MAG TPA: CYTH domain-containing protein [Ignavibacteriaceae bacterium]|jgi:adenylate cyclase|nr:MAG: CYTH domain protein [Ignavibacteria bacterium ADurb.Bin266]OQY71385.1 MAG: adenylate cyclase [Ignavibacteriales bacterium UTCHB2]HQF43710.1 CYTH domain-containing protein [Ignavibacteriaceae bacterium]HQI40784.1 CYTH domain-containing protein [Ignavibacteriaceae bacterium]HQJ45724.1 CYTH domain-containing protein [Ignavibacteriaceae bacterium]
MAIEIERKFLVKGEFRNFVEKSVRIRQGYISSVPERSVRIRIMNDRGFLAIKGETNSSGKSRYEWETEIPVTEAEELLNICEPGLIEKTRHLVKYGKHIFEIDEFYGENNGLILAEIELKSESENIEMPDWIGEEVTGDPKYYNVMLTKKPFSKW